MTPTIRMKNKAQCMLCKTIVESKHVHDFVRCACGEIFVDGGNDYWRAGAKDFKNFHRIDEPIEEVQDAKP